jgi:hypothetical protein
VKDAGLPLVGRLEALRGEAQGLKEEVGALEIDHIGSDGLDEMVKSRHHGGHGFDGR